MSGAVPLTQHIYIYVELKVQLHSFLTLTLDTRNG